jgi:uncharacterized phage-associated protein
MGYPATAVANYLLESAQKTGLSITPMQLLKLVYFAHGWNLALTDQSLIDDQIEAWKFGPVSPSVYQAFKEFGVSPITRKAQSFDLDAFMRTGALIAHEPSLEGPPEATLYAKRLLERILKVYGKLSGPQLSNLTHQPGTPWYVTWFERGGKDRKHTDIPDQLIKDHFKAKMQSPVQA